MPPIKSADRPCTKCGAKPPEAKFQFRFSKDGKKLRESWCSKCKHPHQRWEAQKREPAYCKKRTKALIKRLEKVLAELEDEYNEYDQDEILAIVPDLLSIYRNRIISTIAARRRSKSRQNTLLG